MGARIGAWLNQLLGYVLLDWFDSLRISTLGLYLGWQAVLVTDSLEDVLTASSRGPMPGLACALTSGAKSRPTMT